MVGHQLAALAALEEKLELVAMGLDLHGFLISVATQLVHVLTGVTSYQRGTWRFHRS